MRGLGLSQRAMSKQLRILREEGLATVHADAHRRSDRLDASALRAVDGWLAPYRASGSSASTRWSEPSTQ